MKELEKEVLNIFWEFLKRVELKEKNLLFETNSLFKKFELSAFIKLQTKGDKELFDKLFIAELNQNKLFLEELVFFISKAYFIKKEYKLSIKTDLFFLENFKNSKIRFFQTLYNLASKYYLLNEMKSARHYLLNAMEFVTKNNLDQKDVEVFRVLVRTYILYVAVCIELEDIKIDELYKFAKSILILLSKGKSILRNSDEIKYFLVQAYVQISSVLMIMQKYKEAIEYCLDGLKIIQEQKVYVTNEVKWGIYYNLAFCYFKLQDYKSALKYATKANEVSSKLLENDIRRKRAKELKDELELRVKDLEKVEAVA